MQYLPSGGVKIFANFLHTHLIGNDHCNELYHPLPAHFTLGRKVVLQHFRQSQDCNGYRELKPIEDNPSYNFDFQQTNFLTKEIEVLPVGSYSEGGMTAND